MWNKTKQWIKADKWRLAALITWLGIILFAVLFSIIFKKPGKSTQSDELTQLQWNFEIVKKAYLQQKQISDSLIKRNSVIMYEVKHDTAVLPNIKLKYENQKNVVRELPADEQLRYSAKWLSEEDSIRN